MWDNKLFIENLIKLIIFITLNPELVEKKDPLIMPPDYENLPTPEDRETAKEEISTFEESLGTSIEDDSLSSPSSTEGFILKKIQMQKI